MSDSSFLSKALNTAVASISAPTSLSASVYTGATGVAGTYSYIITAMNGGESTSSTGISYVNAVNSGVAISFSPSANASSYRIYRSGVGATGYLLVGNGYSSSVIYDTFNSTISGYGAYYLGQNTSNKESRALSTSPSPYYTATSTRTLFKEAVLSNNSSDVVTFSLYVTPSGETPSAGNRLFSNVSLDSYETKILSLNTVLDSGDSIYAQASDMGYIPGFGVVSLKISGIEISDN